MMNSLKWNTKYTWLKTSAYLILCLVLLFSVVGAGIAGNALADEKEDYGSLEYPIMRPDEETRLEWIAAYNNAPRAYIDTGKLEIPSPGGSQDLLSHLQYTPVERDQGSCGNCWAWAGTGCLGIALDVQETIKDRLSVQYINSCETAVIGKTCCAGGWLSDVADFYDPITGYDSLTDGVGQCIPWSNTNAYWQDGDESCDTLCGSISTSPNYPITSINEATITTQTVDQAIAIANIKNVLDQNKAVWFAFFLPTDAAWSDFQSFWNNSPENVAYDMDQWCGTPYDPSDGGGHAVLCVGYDDNDANPANHYWIMLNSWGTEALRPNGLFRLEMDMAYDGQMAPGDYSFYWQNLDVTFGDTSQPDIDISPTSFEKTLPPDTSQSYTLSIGNTGGADLTYSITDEDTTVTAPASAGDGIPSSPPEHMGEGLHDVLVQAPSSSEPASPQGTFGAGYDDALHYDDGTADDAWAWNPGSEGNRFAVRFTPLSYPARLETAWVHIWSGSWPDGDHEQFEVEIWDDDGGGGAPGTMLGSTTTTATNWGWWSVDISGMGITITSGDFYIAYRQITVHPDCEGLSADETSPDDRSWLYNSGGWYLLSGYGYYLDWMIRCEVDDTIDCTWLSESPDSGTVPDGAPADSISVTFDTTGLTDGNDYSASIVITSNDPDENPITVPVILHVSSAGEADIIVTPTSFEKTLPPDTSQGYSLNIGNEGDAELSYTISDRETTVTASALVAPKQIQQAGQSEKDVVTAALPTHEEEHGPEQVFEQGDTLEELRDKIGQNGYNFTVDHNWVYDMSPEEKVKFFSRHDSDLPEVVDASDNIGPLAIYLGRKQLPSQFDWRNYAGHSYIGDIGNQGSCGSCYAFGACAAAEGTYNFANGLYDGNCSDFSESFIMWCHGNLPQYNSHFYGCDGADYDYFELTALTVEGICSEADFPYQTWDGCGDHWDDPRITFDSWHRIPCGDINAIKTAIMTYGPVDAAVLTTTAFEAYSSGIYEDSNTACDEDPCYYEPTDHAIALVGWDDNGDVESNGYWILRNSWGSGWGESGYMRIKYRSAVVACAACYLVYDAGEDCPWLSESPASGTVAPGEPADSITVTIDTTGLAPGDYNADIVIDNNDPDENPTIVPVTLHVVSGGGEFVDVLSVDPSLFCKIWAYVSVNTDAGMAGELTADDFTIYEDGVEQTLESFEFTSNATAKLDILFVFDDTGSMGGEIAGMKSKVQDLTDAIESAGVDARYALVSFKDSPEIDQNWTSDAVVFKSAVDALAASGGGDEPEDNLDAIEMGLGLGFRPAAQKVIIDITDAHTHYRGDGSGYSDYTMPEVVADLISSGVSLFVISPDFGTATVLMDNQGMAITPPTSSSTDNDKKILAEDVGGVWLDINAADFDEILDRIVGVLTTAYHVDYTTTNCVVDCTERTVQIVVDDPVWGTDSDTGKYIAPCGECKVLFEQAHSPAIDMGGYYTIESRYSDWAALLESQGMIVESINSGTVTYGMLSDYGVVVIPESTDDYLSSEIDAIKQYVNNGGGLLILGELGPFATGQGITVNSIATEFDISFNDDTVHDSSHNDGQTLWPLIPNFDNSVIGADVSEVAYYCGCSLEKLSGEPFPIAWAYSDAYVSSPPPATTMGANGVEMGTAGETVTESSAAELEAGAESATMAGAENQSAVAGAASSEPAEALVVPGSGSIKSLAGDAESYLFTVADVIFFSYEDNTELELYNSASTLVWSGTLNKGEHHHQTVATGAYKAVGSKAFAVLTGDPITNSVCGYYAMDENGYGASTELYTWVPSYQHSGEKFIIFSYEDNTTVALTETDTGTPIWSGTLNKGEHHEATGLASKYLHVTANKPVSALTAYDQGYFVPSANKGFSGTEFYTYVSAIGAWPEDLSVIAYYDNTNVTIKNSDTGITIWSGTLNSGQSHVESYPTGADLFFTITSSKAVTVSVQPWVPSFPLGYHQGAYVPDSTGAGIGTDLIGSTLGGGYLYVFAYQDGSTVEVHNSHTGVLASTHNLNEGDYIEANPGNGLWRVTSNKPVSAYSGYGTFNADFAPVQFGEVVTTLQVTPNPATVNVGQSTSVEVLVEDYGLPVETALVELSGCGVSESGYTNASGIVNLNVLATSAGTINVAASKGVKSGTAEIEAVPPEAGPTVMMASNYGDGRVVAVGDGNLFDNDDLDVDGTMDLYDHDNEKVAVDIVYWLCNPVPSGVVVSISDASAAPGDSVVVPITISNVLDLASAEIWLSYDNSVVEVNGVTAGDMGALISTNIDNPGGVTKMTWFSITGLAGDLTFANITLDAVGSDGQTSPLDLDVKELADSGANPIPHSVVDGTFSIAMLPVVITNSATSVEETTATGNGDITSTSGENCDKRGFCWSTSSGPDITDSKAEETGSFGTGTFTASMTGLSEGTKYYVRAYAHNSAGYGYGNEVSFTTKPEAPTNFDATVVSPTQINLSWTKGAGAQKTMIRRSTSSYPATPASGDQVYFDTGTANSNTGLTPGTQYYYSAWSWVDGSDIWSDSYDTAEATTALVLPTVITNAASRIFKTTATLNGEITNTGGENCDYRGFVWSDTSHSNPGNTAPASSGYDSNWTSTGSYGTGTFNHGIASLAAGTTYHFRACAHNNEGWSYGDEWSFMTIDSSATIVSIADASTAPGGSVVVPITITCVTDLASVDIWLSYDSSVVEVTSVTAGDMGALASTSINNPGGVTMMNWFSTIGQSGDFTFANITLHAVGSDGQTSPLDLDVKELTDSGAIPISHSVVDGTFSITTIALMEGDATLNDCVSISDAMFIAQYKAGLRAFDADQLMCADTTDDGNVSMVDAMHIAQWLVDPDGTLGVLFKPLWESPADDAMLPSVHC